MPHPNRHGGAFLTLLAVFALFAAPATAQEPAPPPVPAATTAETATAPPPAAIPEPVGPAPLAEAPPAAEPEPPAPFKLTLDVADQDKGCHSLAFSVALTRPGKATVTLHELSGEFAARFAELEKAELAVSRARAFARYGKKIDVADAPPRDRFLADVAASVTPRTVELDFAADGKGELKPQRASFTGLEARTPYVVTARAVDAAGAEASVEPILLRTNSYFKEGSLQSFIVGALLIFFILMSIRQAEAGREFYIRKIAGLNAIDEAVGRATEMGKPVLYLTGLHDLSAISTLASISILSHVAQKTAEYETPILMPNCRSLVMITAKEVVKEAYITAGKADHYQEDNITYLTDDQFGFVSGVDGIMVREKPAANFYLGHFMAESLIYAETGHSIGAIQVAGTSEFSQIPFFITACDYTLIGEELFAAGAYLSRKPRDVGSLRGQDIGKLLILATVVAGVLVHTAAFATGAPGLLAFSEWFRIQ